MSEIWRKAIYKNIRPVYLVSNFGNIYIKPYVDRNGFHRKGRKVSQTDSPDGYKRLNIRLTNGTRRRLNAHILVASTFIPNPHHYKYVTHLNGDRQDNRVTNLRWKSTNFNTGKGSRSYRIRITLSKNQHPVHSGNVLNTIRYLIKRQLAPLLSLRSLYRYLYSKDKIGDLNITRYYSPLRSRAAIEKHLSQIQRDLNRRKNAISTEIVYKRSQHFFPSETSAARWLNQREPQKSRQSCMNHITKCIHGNDVTWQIKHRIKIMSF